MQLINYDSPVGGAYNKYLAELYVHWEAPRWLWADGALFPLQEIKIL